VRLVSRPLLGRCVPVRRPPRGESGAGHNTVGTLVCDDFSCSRDTRRAATSAESGTGIEAIADQVVAERIAGPCERSTQFLRDVAATS